MKTFTKSLLLPVALACASAYAQSIEINYPGNGTTQTLGQTINLELDFPVSTGDLGAALVRVRVMQMMLT